MAGNTGWLLGLVLLAVICAVTMATADVATDPDDPQTDQNLTDDPQTDQNLTDDPQTDQNLTDDPKIDQNLTSRLDVCHFQQGDLHLVTVGDVSRDNEGENSPCDVIKPEPRKEKPLKRKKKWLFWRRHRPPPNTPPFFITCPGDIEVTARVREVGAIVTYMLTAGDKESTTTVTLIQGHKSGSRFKEGVTAMKYMAKDSQGLTATCSFYVRVKVIRCPNVAQLFSFPHGHQSCSGEEKNLYGSVCQHSCLRGYQILGTAQITCFSSGAWSSYFPSCEPMSCGSPERVVGGYVDCPDGHDFPSVCQVKCHPGFYPTGPTRIKCLDSARWSSGLSDCMPRPTKRSNGH